MFKKVMLMLVLIVCVSCVGENGAGDDLTVGFNKAATTDYPALIWDGLEYSPVQEPKTPIELLQDEMAELTARIEKLESERPKILSYLHRNPLNDHLICSEHGDLEPGKGLFITSFDNAAIAFFDGSTYCQKCVSDVRELCFSQYLIGEKGD